MNTLLIPDSLGGVAINRTQVQGGVESFASRYRQHILPDAITLQSTLQPLVDMMGLSRKGALQRLHYGREELGLVTPDHPDISPRAVALLCWHCDGTSSSGKSIIPPRIQLAVAGDQDTLYEQPVRWFHTMLLGDISIPEGALVPSPASVAERRVVYLTSSVVFPQSRWGEAQK